MAGEGRRRQPAGGQEHPDLIEDQQPAAIHAVRDRAAEQRHRDQRPELDGPEQADEERRVGLDVQLIGQRDEGRLGAHPGDEVPADDEPEVTAVAKRGEIRQQPRAEHTIRLRLIARGKAD